MKNNALRFFLNLKILTKSKWILTSFAERGSNLSLKSIDFKNIKSERPVKDWEQDRKRWDQKHGLWNRYSKNRTNQFKTNATFNCRSQDSFHDQRRGFETTSLSSVIMLVILLCFHAAVRATAT